MLRNDSLEKSQCAFLVFFGGLSSALFLSS